MKYAAILIPTPSKDEITGKRIFSEVIGIEDEERDSAKIPRVDSHKDLV